MNHIENAGNIACNGDSLRSHITKEAPGMGASAVARIGLIVMLTIAVQPKSRAVVDGEVIQWGCEGTYFALPSGLTNIVSLLAGMLFGVALLMKLVPAVLLPLAALIVWSRNWEGGRLLPGAVEPGNGQRKCAAQQESQRRLTSAATKVGVWRRMGLKYAIARGMSAPTDPAERDGYEGGLGKALPALVVFQ